MTIPPECEAQILRYFHVEKWPPTTIARQLNINRGTVKRVLARAGLPPTCYLFSDVRPTLHCPSG
jgi:DNA-directed RNA polymerase specialized sigma24 family protein